MEIRELLPLLRAKGVNLTDDDPVFLHLLLNQVVLDDAAIAGAQPSMGQLNIDKLQGVLRGYGIRIKNDDPVFALLALNEIALDRMVAKQRKMLARSNAQRRLSVSLLLLIGACGAGAGIFFGRESSHIVAGLAGMALGGLLGAAATWLLSGQAVSTQPPVAAIKTTYSWTNDEFQRVISNMKPPMDSRVHSACREVLLSGQTVMQAAAVEKLPPERIMRALDEIVERKNKKSLDW